VTDFLGQDQNGVQNSQKSEPGSFRRVFSEVGPQVFFRLFLFIMVCVVITVLIRDVSGIITDFSGWVKGLFEKASIFPDHHGFKYFVQLVLLAVFAGWVINRFRR